MGIFPYGLQQAFLQQKSYRLDTGADAQLATGAGYLGVDGLRGLAGQSRDRLAAIVGCDIGHHLALPIGQEPRKRATQLILRRHGTTLALAPGLVHAGRMRRLQRMLSQSISSLHPVRPDLSGILFDHVEATCRTSVSHFQ